MSILIALIVLISLQITTSFHVHMLYGKTRDQRLSSVLFMGRAAAVRAATKAKTDGAKAKKNNLFAKRLIIAVKAGGPDPEVNRQLGQVISDAKAAQVPKDIIQRNIEKASTTKSDYKQSVFEFYGYGGVGFLVNVLTDNDNRASAEVNLAAKKNNLKSAASNSVKFKFDMKAKIEINAIITEDELMELCLEVGVDDYLLKTEIDGCLSSPSDENKSVIYVDLKDMGALRDILRTKGRTVETSIAALPKEGFVALSDEDFDLNMNAIDSFEALDDVDSIEHNIDLKDN